ncbi:MAG: Minf_1886 family protein [Planctomycetota bacterium]
MLDPKSPLAELLRRDQRYHFDSYIFIFDSLRYAQEKLDMGRVAAPSPGLEAGEEAERLDGEHPEEVTERHITGQDLCEAIRRYALSQYGLLARSVFDHWGIRSTGDFGEIVFNLIDIGQMRKTENDRREDFEDVYDFDEALGKAAVFSEGGGDDRQHGPSDDEERAS